jgi:ribonuclease D
METSIDIEYYNTYDEIEKSINIIIHRGISLVGFDTESTSSDQIDLIQIAISDRQTYVYQISNCIRDFSSNFANTNLSRLLMSKEIVKTGVDINCDMVKLYKTFGNMIRLNSFIDSQAIAITKGIARRSMNDLGKLLIRGYTEKISKGGQYNVVPLNSSQIEYAGRDAIYSFQIYIRLIDSNIQHNNVHSHIDLSVINNSILEYVNSNIKVKKDSLIKYLSNSVSEIKNKIPNHERKSFAENCVYNMITQRYISLRGEWIVTSNSSLTNIF